MPTRSAKPKRTSLWVRGPDHGGADWSGLFAAAGELEADVWRHVAPAGPFAVEDVPFVPAAALVIPYIRDFVRPTARFTTLRASGNLAGLIQAGLLFSIRGHAVLEGWIEATTESRRLDRWLVEGALGLGERFDKWRRAVYGRAGSVEGMSVARQDAIRSALGAFQKKHYEHGVAEASEIPAILRGAMGVRVAPKVTRNAVPYFARLARREGFDDLDSFLYSCAGHVLGKDGAFVVRRDGRIEPNGGKALDALREGARKAKLQPVAESDVGSRRDAEGSSASLLADLPDDRSVDVASAIDAGRIRRLLVAARRSADAPGELAAIDSLLKGSDLMSEVRAHGATRKAARTALRTVVETIRRKVS